MKSRHFGVCVITLCCFAAGIGVSVYAQNDRGKIEASHAKGTFDVRFSPEAPEDKAAGVTLGRMSGEKQYHGDLEGTAKAVMLTAVTGVEGSAAYVAFERVSATLHGRRGTFVLHHTATMAHGIQQLVVTVVPDSGSGDLVGIAGKMTITNEGSRHFYDLEYTLPR